MHNNFSIRNKNWNYWCCTAASPYNKSNFWCCTAATASLITTGLTKTVKYLKRNLKKPSNFLPARLSGQITNFIFEKACELCFILFFYTNVYKSTESCDCCLCRDKTWIIDLLIIFDLRKPFSRIGPHILYRPTKYRFCNFEVTKLLSPSIYCFESSGQSLMKATLTFYIRKSWNCDLKIIRTVLWTFVGFGQNVDIHMGCNIQTDPKVKTSLDLIFLCLISRKGESIN